MNARRDYAGSMMEVAMLLLGEPTERKANELRYGKRGSLSVRLDSGTWYDNEAKKGGGVLALIERETGNAGRAAIEWLESNGIKIENENKKEAGKRIVATYDYVDAHGVLQFQVVRYEPKDFRQRRPVNSGGWSWSVRGIEQLPYRLPELLARPTEVVFVVEGERDADNLAARGLVATCNAGGANKWPDSLSQHFRERNVVIVPDNDDAGRSHARLVANKLHGIASSVRVLELPNLPPKGDVSEWLADGHDAAKLLEMVQAPVASERDETRRNAQQELNARIQDDAQNILPPAMSVDAMLADCVWITSGSQVGMLSNPRLALAFSEFADLTASSVSTRVDNPKRAIANALLWKRDTRRKTVHTRTFRAGSGEICRDPDGELALNSWRPIERSPSTVDVAPFLEQVAYLIEDASERSVFLDWLAHIEQKPGTLPHYGWLHIAKNTGTGRNWLASVLARVWRGYVAPNVDLPALLESQFNGALAGRILAMVDEVQEGGGDNPFRHANRLNAIVNAEERAINPKFGRQFKEHNSCRWLVFSNYENALPLKGTDRRWRVIRHSAAPRSSEAYSRLYALLDNPEFINAVGAWLRERDISAFNPGERPPMNDAKRAALDASKSTVQQSAEDLVHRWPVDVITSVDAADVLSEGSEFNVSSAAIRRALNEAGAVQYGDGRVVKVRRKSAKCWILRNVEHWADASPLQVAAEAARVRGFDETSAMDILASIGIDERPI